MPDSCKSFFIENILNSANESPLTTGYNELNESILSRTIPNDDEPISYCLPAIKKPTKSNLSCFTESTINSPVASPAARDFPAESDVKTNDLSDVTDSIQSQRQFGLLKEHFQAYPKNFCGAFHSLYLSSSGRQKDDDVKRESGIFTPSSSEKLTKRSRITFTAYQVEVLQATYNRTKYLSIGERARMARELGLNERQIKIWFQNQRYKRKKNLDCDSEYSSYQSDSQPSTSHFLFNSSSCSGFKSLGYSGSFSR